MKKEYHDEIKSELHKHLGREAEDHEIVNMENDSLLLARLAIKKIGELEDRIILLEKRKII